MFTAACVHFHQPAGQALHFDDHAPAISDSGPSTQTKYLRPTRRDTSSCSFVARIEPPLRLTESKPSGAQIVRPGPDLRAELLKDAEADVHVGGGT